MHLVFLLACALLGAAPQPAVDPDVAAWVKGRAIPFETSRPASGFRDLLPLRQVVGDARIVSLGEPTHGTREAFQLKHRLLEFLVEEMGFSIFSIEANMPEAYALNEYVINGQGDPSALIAGMYFWTWRTEELLAMVRWMREWNLKHPPESGRPRLQFTGFDMQVSTTALTIAEDFLKAHDHEYYAKVQELLQQLRRFDPFTSGADSFGCATGRFPVEHARGKKVRLSGWIKTRNVDQTWAGLWWRVDGPTPFFDNMPDRGVRGTSDWTQRTIELSVPADAEAIFFGLLLPSSGTAWFDSLEIQIDGQPWSHPDFDLSFERPQPGGIIAANPMRGPPSPQYPGAIDETVAHAGRSSFRLEKVAPATEGLTPVQAAAVAAGVLDHLVAGREGYLTTSDARAADWAIQNARVVRQWTGLSANDGRSMMHRDRCMADNIAWILEHNPGERMVVWAHNGHVSRGEAYGQQWMGYHIAQRFPGQSVVFGFATGRGVYTAVGESGLSSDHPLSPPPPGSVESTLASAGMSRLFLDIRSAIASDPASAWAALPAPMRSIGAAATTSQFYPIVAKDMFDVLVWQEETTASVVLPR